MKKYLSLMRIKHYLKNLLIFAPLLFSGLFLKVDYLVPTIFGLISFSFAASIVYIINDIKDKEKDRLHEKKKNRPIANGSISVKNAIIFAIVLFILSTVFEYLAVGSIIHLSYLFTLIYIVINIAYSFGLKNIPLLDVTILVSGFLLRVLYGSALIGVEISNWLYLTVISISFYLGLGKRRNEIIKNGNKTREVLKYYTKDFLDKNMYMCLAITVVFYALWTVDPINIYKFGNLLVWTVPLIIIILMKYSMNIENDSYGDPVDVVFDDKILLSLIILYGVIVMGIIYL